MHAILAEYGLPYKYPAQVEHAADKIEPGITDEEVARREDFREVLTFTIDPKDAKDFDDALSIRPLDKGQWEVGVHIADVSHYVQEGDIIDREAERRATSVYLVDRTIPMLPERLCNFICSLRPDEDKLAYSTIFRMNERGEVLSWRLRHTVIRSNRRFTYEEVQQVIEQNGEASEQDYNLPGEHPEITGNFENPIGEYARELLAPCYPDKTAGELFADSHLHSIEKTLRDSDRIRVFHTADDFLADDSEKAWLDSVLKERITWFSNGGHLGNLYFQQVLDAIVAAGN
jgi:ribonuclease R